MQYIEFYVKSKHNDFTCIESYSKNSSVYKFCSGPYGKLRKLTISDLREFQDGAKERLKQIHNFQERIYNQIKAIGSYNNSLSEKLDEIHGFYEILDEYEQECDEISYAIKFFEVMGHMVDVMSYQENGEGIYYGIEVGENPVVEDTSFSLLD